MKYVILAIAAALIIAGCTGAPAANNNDQPAVVDTGGTAADSGATDNTNYCGGLTIDLLSPAVNELVSGGFRAEWTLKNVNGPSYVNRDVSFVIFMKPAGGAAADLKSVSGIYGNEYSSDITFLNKLTAGSYIVGVRGSMSDCAIPAAEVAITVA